MENREIKFRGKNTINGNWVYGYYVVVEGFHKIQTDHTLYPIHPYSVGEFTGLTDKKGKEIYEGDIVQRQLFSDTSEEIGNISVNDGAFTIIFPSDVFLLHTEYPDCVVLGNIFDQRELLKK